MLVELTSKTRIVAAAGGCTAAALVVGVMATLAGGDPAAGLSPVRDSALGGRPWPAVTQPPADPLVARSSHVGARPH